MEFIHILKWFLKQHFTFCLFPALSAVFHKYWQVYGYQNSLKDIDANVGIQGNEIFKNLPGETALLVWTAKGSKNEVNLKALTKIICSENLTAFFSPWILIATQTDIKF